MEPDRGLGPEEEPELERCTGWRRRHRDPGSGPRQDPERDLLLRDPGWSLGEGPVPDRKLRDRDPDLGPEEDPELERRRPPELDSGRHRDPGLRGNPEPDRHPQDPGSGMEEDPDTDRNRPDPDSGPGEEAEPRKDPDLDRSRRDSGPEGNRGPDSAPGICRGENPDPDRLERPDPDLTLRDPGLGRWGRLDWDRIRSRDRGFGL